MPLPRFDKLDDARKHSILDAATEEIAEHGFERASYNRIIERAGISKGAMYYYFADKNDLFQTVVESCVGQWLTVVGFPFEADDATSFWAACRAIYARSLGFMLRDPRNAKLTFDLARARGRGDDGPPVVRALTEQLYDFLVALAQQGQRLGAVRTDLPVELLVHTLFALIDAGDRWLAERWKEDMTEEEVAATAGVMVGIFQRVAAPLTTPIAPDGESP